MSEKVERCVGGGELEKRMEDVTEAAAGKVEDACKENRRIHCVGSWCGASKGYKRV